MVPFAPSVFTLALSLALLPSLALANDARPLSKADAMIVVDATTPAPQIGQGPRSIVCDATHRVGIWLESTVPVVLERKYIVYCDVGIVVAPSPGVTHTITTMRIRRARLGLWNRADGTIIRNNTVWESQYGILLSGNHAMVDTNSIQDVAKDGLTVVGHGNTILRTRIRRAGRFGLQVLGAVPQLRKDESLLGLRDDAAGNHIEGNSIWASGDLDLRQWPIHCGRTPRNTFLGNSFGTTNANCLE